MTYGQLFDLVLKAEGYNLEKPVKVSLEFYEYDVKEAHLVFSEDDKDNPIEKIVLSV